MAKPVVRADGDADEPLRALPRCGHANPVEGCSLCRPGVLVDATLASVPSPRQSMRNGRQRAGLRRVSSERSTRKPPASVAARALTGGAIVVIAWLFAVGAVVVLTGGGSAHRATRGSRAQTEVKRGRSATVSVLAGRQTTAARSRSAPAPTATVSALAGRQTTATQSRSAPAPTATVSALAGRQTTAARSRSAPAPTAALDAYWQSVKRHSFADAYAQLLPGSTDITEAQFVAYEKQIEIQGASFQGSITSRTHSQATVAVRSLITRDQRYGCQTWSGSYELTETAGRWRIARAVITPGPCGR